MEEKGKVNGIEVRGISVGKRNNTGIGRTEQRLRGHNARRDCGFLFSYNTIPFGVVCGVLWCVAPNCGQWRGMNFV